MAAPVSHSARLRAMRLWPSGPGWFLLRWPSDRDGRYPAASGLAADATGPLAWPERDRKGRPGRQTE